MYTYVKTYATMKGLTQTVEVLPYARELHKGQVRKGKDEVPYIISENGIATMVKLIDRCNNVSAMSTGFSKERIIEYINETEKYVYPLLQKAKTKYSKYSNQVFLIKYHMTSVVTTLKHQFMA